MKNNFLITFLLFALISCGQPPIKDVDQKNGFYFWKGYNNFNKAVYDQLDSFDTKVVYLRFFDVDWDEATSSPVPVGDVNYEFDSVEIFKKYQVVPTIFITNTTFKNISGQNIPKLADKVYKRILNCFADLSGEYAGYSYENYSYETNNPYQEKSGDLQELVKQEALSRDIFNRVTEIQFDCDWTESTRDKYFLFLTEMRSRFTGKKISCTIRLYPYKYPEKAGVPPVDKGVLMCYNMGDVRDPGSPNSIFNKSEALKYIKPTKEYPLMLDYAFPAFEWIAQYRKGKLINIYKKEEFYFNSSVFKELSSKGNLKKYECINNNEPDIALKGDILKVETISYPDVIYVARTLSGKNTNPQPHILLFDFDQQIIRSHSNEIKKIYSSF